MERVMRMRDEETSSDISEITVDSAEMVYDQGGATSSSDLDYPTLDLMPTEWTDEKHSLYLKSMEASFVKELHSSMGLLKDQLQKHASNKAPSVQFKSLKDGTWKNVTLYKYGNAQEATTESRSILENPWIKHFRRTGNNHVLESLKAQDIDLNPDWEIEAKMKSSFLTDMASKQLTTTISDLCRQNSVDSNIEMSGQNFDKNDRVMSSSRLRRAKRKKTETTSNTANDQVVPFFTSAIVPKEMR